MSWSNKYVEGINVSLGGWSGMPANWQWSGRRMEHSIEKETVRHGSSIYFGAVMYRVFHFIYNSGRYDEQIHMVLAADGSRTSWSRWAVGCAASSWI